MAETRKRFRFTVELPKGKFWEPYRVSSMKHQTLHSELEIKYVLMEGDILSQVLKGLERQLDNNDKIVVKNYDAVGTVIDTTQVSYSGYTFRIFDLDYFSSEPELITIVLRNTQLIF